MQNLSFYSPGSLATIQIEEGDLAPEEYSYRFSMTFPDPRIPKIGVFYLEKELYHLSKYWAARGVGIIQLQCNR